MRLFRITQSTLGENRYRAELRLEGDGVPFSAVSEFAFEMSPQDHENLRWYLEEYLQYPQDPAPRIAAAIEQRMAEIGTQLFQSLLHANDDTRHVWTLVREKLSETRIELIATVREASSLPWELIRDPTTNEPVALHCSAFVRGHQQPARRPKVPQTADPIRILLAICRPAGNLDVPFRSVATHLIKGLEEGTSATYQLNVLRPPTFGCLGHVLRQAKAKGKPYHVLHFDGHGIYADPSSQSQVIESLQRPISFSHGSAQSTKQGYLFFEDPDDEENYQLVDGTTLGGMLVETGVPVLVLNACQSAHAEPPAEPRDVSTVPSDPHAEVRAYGSLAQEVMDAGVAGVVAIRYSVYVVTAAQFVANLYGSLVQGYSLGEAVTLSRKQLAEQPQRGIAYERQPLQDWCVPIAYEAVPIRLFFASETSKPPQIVLDDGIASAGQHALDDALPRSPDVGFFGRDETILAIDRAFDRHPIVLLSAYAGSGKTSTAAEFARWYELTGGVQGPVLFSTFEHHLPLSRVLDRIGQCFESVMQQLGIHWLTLDDAQRRKVALQLLAQVPVLWIWDNVEPIAGFPAPAESPWTKQEQQDLADFLRDARHTRAKFLLTSRRDERTWLGDLPRRIAMPPMPMQERVQLARALADRLGRQLSDVGAWLPLLRFTEGNPLTVIVAIRQGLCDGLRTREEVELFVQALRAGGSHFDDDSNEGRSRSLGASLSYGFEHAFTAEERRQLAVVSLFQSFVV